jgi:exportin-1
VDLLIKSEVKNRWTSLFLLRVLRKPAIMTTSSFEDISRLWTIAGDIDVTILDQMIVAAYSPTDPNRAMANKMLMQLQESPDLWTKADAIIEKSLNPQSRFFGLQALDAAIKTRWKIVPVDQREGIKNYVVGKIINLASSDETLSQEKVFIGKLNLTLVEILKQEVSSLVRRAVTWGKSL